MKNTPRQYTIRNIPDQVDRTLRQRARVTGKSFNQVVVEALYTGIGETHVPKRDLSFLIGSIDQEEADRLDAEVARQRRIDPDLWT